MLSIVDLKRELGENIYVYPLHSESIKANSIDLHVSRFAWSLKTKEFIGDDNYIVIGANDTALVYTEESIYVSNKIGGSYHSKVTLVSKGAGHIGTTLDSQYIGCSLMAIHNHSSEQISLKVGSEFVTLQLWYLNSPGYENIMAHDNEPGHPRMLNGYKNVEDYIEWRDRNTWATRKMDLYHRMLESDEYKKCKEEYKRELDKFDSTYREEQEKVEKNINKKKLISYIKLIVVTIIICVIFLIPAYIVKLKYFSDICKVILEKVVFPLSLTILTTYVIIDNKDKNNK